jgi:ABC-type molybdate transport system substrate-binding protein
MASAGDVTVFCDPALKPAMLAMSGLGGFGVYPLCAPGPAMVAQIIRHTRNDVLFTLSPTMDDAAVAGLINPASRADGFSNKLVLAGLRGSSAPPQDAAVLQALLAKSRVAVTDDTPASCLDGRAILAANNLAAPNIQGAADTGDVAFLLATGAADIGLIYQSEAQAHPRLTVLATLNAPPAITFYAAAVNAHAFSPNAQALINLLRSPGGIARLNAAGIEMSS